MVTCPDPRIQLQLCYIFPRCACAAVVTLRKDVVAYKITVASVFPVRVVRVFDCAGII